MNHPLTLKQANAAVNLLIGCLEDSQRIMSLVFNDPENPRNGKIVGPVWVNNQNTLRIIKSKLL